MNRLSELRRQADYGYEPIEEDVSDLVERASAFVETMASIVPVE